MKIKFTSFKTLSTFLFFSLCIFVSTNQHASIYNLSETEVSAQRDDNNVRISGSAFQKFEQVTITVECVSYARSSNDLPANRTVFADSFGNISADWHIPFDRRVIVRGTGNETKSEAETAVSSAIVPPILVTGNPRCASFNADNANFPIIVSESRHQNYHSQR